jgi:cation:H+ antiporter
MDAPTLVLLLCLLVGYTWIQIRIGLREGAGAPDGPGPAPAPPRVPRSLALVAGGLCLLVLGTRWFLEGAVAVARAAGLSELVIGLTLVAGGTSLPEVVTSVLATVRGQGDIAVGNVVGSNIFNALGVLGIAGVVAPDGLPAAPVLPAFDLPLMLAVAAACLPIFLSGRRIDRWEGFLFLAAHAAYTAFLVLDATGHAGAAGYRGVMLSFVIPLLGATVAAIALQAVRDHGAERTAPPPG